ncbi:hypothetical protein EBR25_14010 [bacterium]|nr:hypothetical protein [bacterium]
MRIQKQCESRNTAPHASQDSKAAHRSRPLCSFTSYSKVQAKKAVRTDLFSFRKRGTVCCFSIAAQAVGNELQNHL